MAEYTNPMEMFQNVNPVPNNPFWSGMEGARNQMQAQPFLDMQQQSQQYDLQKKGMETGEFMGQEAQGMRSAERQKNTQKSKEEIQQSLQNIRGMGPEMDAKIAKADDIVRRLKGTQHQDMLTDIGQLHDVIARAPEEQRSQLWAGMIQRWQMTHPGTPVPENFRQYSPEHLKDAAAIRYAQLNTPEQTGKERLKDMEITGGLVREGQQQEGATTRALIAERSHQYTADKYNERAANQETPQKAVARLRRTLSTDPKNFEAIDEYKTHLDDAWQKEKSNDMTFAMLQIRQMNSQDPKQQEEATKKMGDLRNKFYADRGIYLDAPQDGTVRSFEGKNYKFDGGFGKNPRDKKNWKVQQ